MFRCTCIRIFVQVQLIKTNHKKISNNEETKLKTKTHTHKTLIRINMYSRSWHERFSNI